jgi:hypothetical protein
MSKNSRSKRVEVFNLRGSFDCFRDLNNTIPIRGLTVKEGVTAYDIIMAQQCHPIGIVVP